MKFFFNFTSVCVLSYSLLTLRSDKHTRVVDEIANTELGTGKRGGKVLTHNGYRFHRSNIKTKEGVYRWICLQILRCKCNAHAFTKDIDRVEMAYFPPDANEQHNHELESYGDLQKDQEMDVEPSAAMKIEKNEVGSRKILTAHGFNSL